MSPPGRMPTRRSASPTAATALVTGELVATPSTSSAKGSVAARMARLTSRPSPPLATRTMRSDISGNW